MNKDNKRKCTKCKRYKSLEDYYYNPKHYTDDYSRRCKKCLRKIALERYYRLGKFTRSRLFRGTSLKLGRRFGQISTTLNNLFSSEEE